MCHPKTGMQENQLLQDPGYVKDIKDPCYNYSSLYYAAICVEFKDRHAAYDFLLHTYAATQCLTYTH